MKSLLARLAQNKHTSGAGIAYGAVMILNKLGAIWFPAHKAQFDATAEVLKGAALSYGLLMAGDGQPQSNQNQDGARSQIAATTTEGK